MPRRPRADELVRTAAFLKRELEGRNASIAFLGEREGNRIIYAFDSDIIITKCAPWITGPVGDEDNNGYGAFFHTDDRQAQEPQEDRKAETIASILATKVLEALKNDKLPVFQFPSHARETNNVYRAVRRIIETVDRFDPRKADTRRMIELNRAIALVRFYAETGEDGEDVHRAIDRIVALLTYRDQPASRLARALQEWDAYYSLEAEFGGIYPLSNAPAWLGKDNPAVARAFAVFNAADRTIEEDVVLQNVTEYWVNDLSRRRRRNIDADAEALAYLFLVNYRLADTGTKCVFVTGDRGLARAAYSGVPLNLIPPAFQKHAQRFSVDYVRHLWSYTTDALIEQGREQEFVDLFSGLLAYWSEQLNFPLKTLEDLSSSQSARIGTPPGRYLSDDNVNRTLNEWDALTAKSVSNHLLKRVEETKKLQNAIWAAVKKCMNDGQRWTDLRKVVQEEFHRIRDRTILSMSDLGIDVIIHAERLGRRNPPELVFESLTNTNRIFERLTVSDSYRDSESFERDLAKIKDDCWDARDGDDRQESHLKFLVLGAAFASAERWLIALNHATRAIAIIERSRRFGPIPVRHDGSSGSKSHMSGREAYFLAAVAQRMLAASPAEFDAALRYLAQSSAALRDDHRHGSAFGITPARFDSEGLAISLGRYYHARSSQTDEFFDDLVVEIYRSAMRAVPLFVEWRVEDNPKALRRVTAVNLATNLIQTYVIAAFRRHRGLGDSIECPVSPELLQHAVAAIRRLTNYDADDDKGRINATRLIRAYAIVGEMFAEESIARRVELRDQLLRLLERLDQVVVTHYDDWRYTSLIEFVHERFFGKAITIRN